MEGLIHGGAYFWNFTVFHRCNAINNISRPPKQSVAFPIAQPTQYQVNSKHNTLLVLFRLTARG